MATYTDDDLTPFTFAQHGAMSALTRAEGYACAPHWLCCSSEAKAKAFGFLYGRLMAGDALRFEQVEPFVTGRWTGTPDFLSWREGEVAAAKRRGDVLEEVDE